MADVHQPGQAALHGEPTPSPKVVAVPPPGYNFEQRVSRPEEETGSHGPPQNASISADGSQAAAQAQPQPPRVSGSETVAGEAQVVQQQPAAVLTSVRTEACRAESAASAIEDTEVEGRRKVIIRVPKGWYAAKGRELTLGDGERRWVGEAIGKGCQVGGGLCMRLHY